MLEEAALSLHMAMVIVLTFLGGLMFTSMVRVVFEYSEAFGRMNTLVDLERMEDGTKKVVKEFGEKRNRMWWNSVYVMLWFLGGVVIIMYLMGKIGASGWENELIVAWVVFLMVLGNVVVTTLAFVRSASECREMVGEGSVLEGYPGKLKIEIKRRWKKRR